MAMMVWCRECGGDTPISYRDGCGLRWPHFSMADGVRCVDCALRLAAVRAALERDGHTSLLATLPL